MEKRERFSSRLGFILISAGCAIGLGNVWRFPYITGKYGGAAFVLIYLIFLIILGMPIMAMEFAVGRASQKSAARSFHVLEPKGTKWHIEGYLAMLGNYLLMMFYTTVGGWMISYIFKIASGSFQGLAPDQVGGVFNDTLASVTLPNIFNQMAAGRLWGTLFFIFMSFAALSTIIAVFENIISFGIDLWGWTRKKSVLVNLVLILVLSLPCVLGFNVWSGIAPLGAGSTIQDLEDFIVSNNLLPLGSLLYLLFCTSRYGWGWDNFIAEADAGKGIKFPKWARFYVSYILPLIVLFILVMGYWQKFAA